MKALPVAALLVMLPPAGAALAAEGSPGTSDATLEVSWAHFERVWDDDGEARTLDAAFGPDAKGVGIDAILFQFGGRYVFGPGLEGWVDVPLLRLARTGEIEGGLLLDDESLYAETIAMGDVSAGVRFEIPLEHGDDVSSAFGIAGLLKAPTGNFDDVDPSEMPTGGGDFGIGGELFAVARPFHGEVGAAASLLLLLAHERDDVTVDRGDVRAGRLWVALPVGSRVKAGVRLLAWQREPDRAGGEPVRASAAGGHPGVLVPESRLLSIAPYVEISPAPRMRFAASVGSSTTAWAFFPGEAGIGLDGKNVLLPGAQVRVSFLTGF